MHSFHPLGPRSMLFLDGDEILQKSADEEESEEIEEGEGDGNNLGIGREDSLVV